MYTAIDRQIQENKERLFVTCVIHTLYAIGSGKMTFIYTFEGFVIIKLR